MGCHFVQQRSTHVGSRLSTESQGTRLMWKFCYKINCHLVKEIGDPKIKSAASRNFDHVVKFKR